MFPCGGVVGILRSERQKKCEIEKNQESRGCLPVAFFLSLGEIRKIICYAERKTKCLRAGLEPAPTRANIDNPWNCRIGNCNDEFANGKENPRSGGLATVFGGKTERRMI